jgi:hypothetical protein
VTELPNPGRVVRHNYRGQSGTEQPSYYRWGQAHRSGGTGIRTPDPLHAMQVLYQLSYTPKGITMLPVQGQFLFKRDCT